MYQQQWTPNLARDRIYGYDKYPDTDMTVKGLNLKEK